MPLIIDRGNYYYLIESQTQLTTNFVRMIVFFLLAFLASAQATVCSLALKNNLPKYLTSALSVSDFKVKLITDKGVLLAQLDQDLQFHV